MPVGGFIFALVCLVSPTMDSEIAFGRLKEASSCDAVHQTLYVSSSLYLRLLMSILALNSNETAIISLTGQEAHLR